MRVSGVLRVISRGGAAGGGEEAAGDAELVNLDEVAHLRVQDGAGRIDGGGPIGQFRATRASKWDEMTQLWGF